MSPVPLEPATPSHPVFAHLFAWGFPVLIYAVARAIDISRGLS